MNRLGHLLVPTCRAKLRNLRNRPENSRAEFEKVLARIVRRYISLTAKALAASSISARLRNATFTIA